ncbi:Alkylated DNA repair protein (alkB homolog), putative [Trypanosoma equiperdum]|uniref:Alkylated DNA repair protein (AlkB homolog), putative n=1 Tax=Trypanosoma equiperdum TaxID=5694 RepID=A0A1G4I2T5_TRYEQ|nr:Alkylated DNA repair protein (alkB homolog), putative [Trypanosoma equiperdum]
MEDPVRCECQKHAQDDGYSQGELLPLTAFRQVEKRYKLYRYDRRTSRRLQVPETDFSDVVDFRNLEANKAANLACISTRECHEDDRLVKCCTFAGVPGMEVFPNFLTDAEQQEFCRAALLEYGDSRRHPNHLSTHASEPRETTRYEPPMRWATVGFSYQWSSKSYCKEKYSHFPRRLRKCVERIARLCNVSQPYEPQTSIVNYFPVGAMMMAHQDVSEEVLQQPLISISLGCSCVFLMGTESRDDTPCAFWLRSGDVIVVSGASRTAYHGVPRIMDDCPQYLCPQNETEEEEREFYWREQMRHLRVNINVRQVYPDRCEFLNE